LIVAYRPLADLVPYAKNARRHSPTQVAKIKASLQEFGWANVMLVADNQMIAGHARLAAALELLKEGKPIPHTADQTVGPTIDLSHLSPAQRRAYILADNRLAEEAIWDLDLLRGEITDLSAGGFDLGLVGFDGSEIDHIMGGWNTDFGGKGSVEASLDPLIGVARLRYRRADVTAIIAAVTKALEPFEGATVEPL
jgi:ParB-like chromosome segregation protein Spo0J